MQLTDFDYNLPEHAITDRPPEERGASRLLLLNKTTGAVTDTHYRYLADYLRSGDVLVLNNTKVLPARLIVQTEAGGQRELLLLERHGRDIDSHRSKVMYRRSIKADQKLLLKTHEILVEQVNEDGTALVSSKDDLWELAEQYGSMPLPPYMHRAADQSDAERYQTVFAKERGSVAAPTASLNLTQEILETVRAKDIAVAELTLHVGLGTFMPIRTRDVAEHKMHQEYFEIPAATAATIRKAKIEGRRVIAVGTTVTRTLEYAQEQVLNADSSPIHGEADIFIYPGYEFKIIDGLLTNFHAPHSTVLMMAAAYAGWGHLRAAYDHALEVNYKFLSYGDSMLII